LAVALQEFAMLDTEQVKALAALREETLA